MANVEAAFKAANVIFTRELEEQLPQGVRVTEHDRAIIEARAERMADDFMLLVQRSARTLQQLEDFNNRVELSVNTFTSDKIKGYSLVKLNGFLSGLFSGACFRLRSLAGLEDLVERMIAGAPDTAPVIKEQFILEYLAVCLVHVVNEGVDRPLQAAVWLGPLVCSYVAAQFAEGTDGSEEQRVLEAYEKLQKRFTEIWDREKVGPKPRGLVPAVGCVINGIRNVRWFETTERVGRELAGRSHALTYPAQWLTQERAAERRRREDAGEAIRQNAMHQLEGLGDFLNHPEEMEREEASDERVAVNSMEREGGDNVRKSNVKLLSKPPAGELVDMFVKPGGDMIEHFIDQLNQHLTRDTYLDGIYYEYLKQHVGGEAKQKALDFASKNARLDPIKRYEGALDMLREGYGL